MVKFNFDKFVKANEKQEKSVTPQSKERENAQKRADEIRRTWLTQFRERWQNRIIYPKG